MTLTLFWLLFLLLLLSLRALSSWRARTLTADFLRQNFVDLFPLRRISTDWTNSERPQTHKTTDVVALHVEARAWKIVRSISSAIFRLLTLWNFEMRCVSNKSKLDPSFWRKIHRIQEEIDSHESYGQLAGGGIFCIFDNAWN